MATAGDGALAPTSSAYGGGGVGGKFDKRYFRRNRATPYDRPPTALRNPSWVSKLLVDPAKKFIASSANAVFSSVFRKSLPPPPAPPESNPELSDRIQAPDVHDEGPLAGADCQNPRSEKSGMLELEQLLKQKAFTRSEIDRLTDLLRSKAVDLPAEKDVKSPGTSLSRPVTDILKHQEYRESPLAEKGLEVERSQGIVLTPGISSRVLDEDIATPAELAKAYMDRLPSKVSPAMLSLRSQSTRKEGALLSNTPLFTPTSSVLTLGTKTAGHFELGKNGFTTPSSRGRSAIYSMARTPYSRAYPTTSGKAGGPSGYLSPSPNTLLQDGKLGSKKLAQKRGSSVLDDFGSVGPMRRTRQKHGLVPHKVAISPRGVDFSKEVQKSSSMLHKHSFMGDWNDARSKNLGDKAANSPSTSSHVPPRCSEVAARILQQLENISPKEKSAESKLNASGERSPSKLTTEMLRRPAPNNLENAGSSKMLWSIQDHQKLDTSSNRGLTGVQEGTSGIQESGDQNGPRKLYFQQEMMNGDAAVSAKRVLTGGETSYSLSISVAQSPKCASMIHAHEGSLGLDVGTYNNGPASEGRGKFQISAASQHLDSAKSTKDKSPGVAELKKAPPEPVFGKTSDLRIFGDGTGAFSALPSSTTTSETVKLSPSVSVSEKPKEVGQSSSLALAAEASAPKSRFSMLPKPLSSFSSAGGTGLSLQDTLSNKHDDSILQEDAKATETSKALHSGNFSSSMSNSTPSFSLFDNSNLKNGSGSMSSPSLSSPPLASAGFSNQVLTNFASSASHSGNSTSSATAAWMCGASGSPSFSAMQPSSSATAFESGSFVKTSTAVSVTSVASDAEAHVMVNKVDKEANGNSHTQPLGFGSGSTTVSQSVPFQFGSSTSSPIYGTSGVAPFTFSAAPFSSSSSVSNLFASSPSFGLSSTASSTESKSVVSATGGASGTFSFAATMPATSSGAIGFTVPSTVCSSSGSLTTSSVTGMVGSNSSVTPVTFNFGASPSGNNFASSSAGSLSSNFGSSLSSSAGTSSVNPGTANSSAGFSWQTPQSSSIATFNSTPSSDFTFGSSAPVFSYAATPSVPSFASPPMFGNPASTFQTNTDDSMAEDTTQSSNSTVPVFGQPPVPSPSGFTFSSTVQPSSPFQFGGQPSLSTSQNSQFQYGGQPSQSASQNSPFQFSGQPSQIASQNPPFQGTGSLELNAGGGSFVFGSGGEKSSGRRTVKINRNKHRKK